MAWARAWTPGRRNNGCGQGRVRMRGPCRLSARGERELIAENRHRGRRSPRPFCVCARRILCWADAAFRKTRSHGAGPASRKADRRPAPGRRDGAEAAHPWLSLQPLHADRAAMPASAHLLRIWPCRHRQERRMARLLADAVARVALPPGRNQRLRPGSRHSRGTASGVGGLALWTLARPRYRAFAATRRAAWEKWHTPCCSRYRGRGKRGEAP
jgi:hypothetical protein